MMRTDASMPARKAVFGITAFHDVAPSIQEICDAGKHGAEASRWIGNKLARMKVKSPQVTRRIATGLCGLLRLCWCDCYKCDTSTEEQGKQNSEENYS